MSVINYLWISPLKVLHYIHWVLNSHSLSMSLDLTYAFIHCTMCPCKTMICNYLKSPNKYGTRKLTRRLEKLSPQFKRRIVHKVKKKTLSTSKILKSLVDASWWTRTIRRHLNNEKIKHKKRIHSSRFTKKHKQKRLEYACQYQNHEW